MRGLGLRVSSASALPFEGLAAHHYREDLKEVGCTASASKGA